MYVDLEELAGTRRNSHNLHLILPVIHCLAVTNQLSIVTNTRFLEFSAVLSTLQARCQLRPKHPTTKETIDEIPETTLASIAATEAGTQEVWGRGPQGRGHFHKPSRALYNS